MSPSPEDEVLHPDTYGLSAGFPLKKKKNDETCLLVNLENVLICKGYTKIKEFFFQENLSRFQNIFPAGFALIIAWYANKDECRYQPIIIDQKAVLNDFI